MGESFFWILLTKRLSLSFSDCMTAAGAQNNGSLDLNLEDPELEKAATRIQAAFRGHNTRKQLGGEKMAEGQEEIDIDLNDPGKRIWRKKISLCLFILLWEQ